MIVSENNLISSLTHSTLIKRTVLQILNLQKKKKNKTFVCTRFGTTLYLKLVLLFSPSLVRAFKRF